MRLKRYTEYNRINESFQRSNESDNFLREHSLDREFFLDSLAYVGDIKSAGINLVKYVCDKDGGFLTDNFDDSKEYRIRYMLTIKYDLPTEDSKLEDLFKEIDELEEIKTSIEEMKGRVSEKVTLVWDKSHFEPMLFRSEISRSISIENLRFNFSLHFDGEVINNKLKPYFNRYKSYTGPDYEKMMSKLRAFYDTYDIEFDKHFDVLDDEEDLIRVAVFPPDGDLYHVADYYKSSGKYDIDHHVLTDSLYGFGLNP